MTSSRFTLHDARTAPVEARGQLEATQKSYGMIPNLEKIMAEAPELLHAYSTLWDLFQKSSLSETEQNVVLLTVSVVNECHYCVPWHTRLAGENGLEAADIESLRCKGTIKDARLEALRRFTVEAVEGRGRVSDETFHAFTAAGFTARQALEVILGIGTKTLSNYTSGLADPPLEPVIRKLEWKPSSM